MTLKVKVNDPHFRYQLRDSTDANLVIVAQIHYKLSHGHAKFPRILSQNCQNDLEDQGQWPPFSIPVGSIPGCMFAANWVILVQILDELLCGQAEFPGILSQRGPNDFEGQGQWPLFSIPAGSIPWCMFGANLVIPAQICDKLLCGQGQVYGQTDGQTDGQMQATTIPLRPERPRGKNLGFLQYIYICYHNTWTCCTLHLCQTKSAPLQPETNTTYIISPAHMCYDCWSTFY